MTVFLLGLAILIVLLTVACLYRLAKGPTVFDRMIAAGLVGTNGIIILVLIGVIYGRTDMFVDIAIIYAILNFVGVIALMKYFEWRGE